MTHGSYHPQPGNPDSYDFHAYYGGTGDPNQYGTPHGHGHLQITNDQTVYHRVPVERAIGMLAVEGQMPPTYRR